jgi:hypothetical protein
MPGIEHYRVEKACRLMPAEIRRSGLTRGEKNARKDSTDDWHPKKTEQATRH